MMNSLRFLILIFALHPQLVFAQSQTTTVYLSAEENNFYQIINQFRSKLGLPTLQIHVALQNAARDHSDWMEKQDFLTHYGPLSTTTPFQRMEAKGYLDYNFAGENIACGFAEASKTFKQWAYSPGHLKNMINPHFHQMGIARSGDGNEKCPYYWTNDFGSFTDPETDPAEITDLNLINNAVIQILGPQNNSVTLPAINNPILSNQQKVSILQCMIPATVAKGVLTYTQNLDALLTAKLNEDGSYSLNVNYFQNTVATNTNPFYLGVASVTKNSDYPILTLFSAPGSRLGGFMIQVNTKTNKAQFDSYPNSQNSSNAIECTMKY